MRNLNFFKKFNSTLNLQYKWFSTKAKLVNEVEQLLIHAKINPKRHPGIIKDKLIGIPKWITEAMDHCLEDANVTQLCKESLKFSNYLFSRRLPLEQHEFEKTYLDIEESMLNKLSKDLSEQEFLENRKKIKGKVTLKLKQKVFSWKPIEYNNYKSLLYLITRSIPEYYVLKKIFNEIHSRDADFSPQTIFDFGSGVGSVLWASNEHWKNVNEYLGIDISNDMNDLSQKIISYSPIKIKGIFYRQYLPFSNLKHDLVISAYSLMELPDIKTRLDVISKLWKKTDKYLIIVEQGTNAGFKLINEVRDFIVYYSDKVEQEMKYSIFAPCPHEMKCPRYQEEKTPCNFITWYMSSPLLGPSLPKQELFSYIVIKKGERTKENDWSRLVRPTLLRSKHVWCRLCTPSGKLQEIVVTASKYGKPLYKCAKTSKWGDRLPLEFNSNEENKISEVTEELHSNTLEIKNKLGSEKLENDNKEKSESEDKTELKQEEENILYSHSPFSIKKRDL